MSDPISRPAPSADQYPEIEFPTVKPSLPVGTIIASILTPDIFSLTVEGDWKLANGQILEEGTLLARIIRTIESRFPNTYSSSTFQGPSIYLPNLGGRFLRGKNNTAGANPDGELPLCTSADDTLRYHQHQFNRSDRGNGGVERAAWGYSGVQNTGIARGITNFMEVANVPGELNSQNGTLETRPKNVTVNYFIRVN